MAVSQTNNPTSWSWTYNGGTPDSKTVDRHITVVPAGSYCESHSTSNAVEWIKNVVVGSFSNPSGASLYSDFTGLTVNLSPGSAYSFTLPPFTTSQRNFWRIWIDFNADGDFDDSGEQVFAANNKKGNATGTITMPATASGQTRLRVTEKTGGSPTSCEVFTNGEVEDYTMSFASGPVSATMQNKLMLELYPNPASDMLNIVLSGHGEKVNIKVTNAFGQVIDDFNVTTDRTSLNLNSYLKGIYYIGADDGSQTTLKKFIRE
ncbi:MAG TPA: GEVED domain-containing protein [Bacteroidales bacterium]|nr:GEVED domain-containing protein [Bacteroidales bacterium]HNS47102.1 GEVED domain-containing protein [Bacteroidales bacterium]